MRLDRCSYTVLFSAAALIACGDSTSTSDSQTGTATATATTPTTAPTSETTQTSTSTSETSNPTSDATGSSGSSGSTASTSTSTTTPDPTTSDPSTSGTTGPDTTGDSMSSTSSSTSGTTGVMEECECADVEVPLDDGIFVLSDEATLWKYRPEQNDFTDLGAIGCNMPNTFSMGVDRLGYAWVMFNPPAGEIRKVDVTQPMNCEDPGYNMGQQGVNLFGMAFVSESQVVQCDKLYGNTYSGQGGFSEGPGLGDFLVVDPDTLVLDKLGETTFNGAELTGTGDGRVFMFGGIPSKLVEVNKENGNYMSEFDLADLPLTNAFAFAFFAGDFYFFTESGNPGSNSKVTHLDYDDSDNDGEQQLTTVNMQAPIRIVGAGVSTCAPFLPM